MRATRRLAGAGVAVEDHVQAELGRGQAGVFAFGLNLKEVGERADFFLDVGEADEAVEFGHGLGELLSGSFVGGRRGDATLQTRGRWGACSAGASRQLARWWGRGPWCAAR